MGLIIYLISSDLISGVETFGDYDVDAIGEPCCHRGFHIVFIYKCAVVAVHYAAFGYCHGVDSLFDDDFTVGTVACAQGDTFRDDKPSLHLEEHRSAF